MRHRTVTENGKKDPLMPGRSLTDGMYRLNTLREKSEGTAEPEMAPKRRSDGLRTRRSAVVAAAISVLLVAGCSSSGDTDDATTTVPESSSTTPSSSTSSTTSSSSSTTTSAPEDDEQAIVDQYLGFWDARFEANSEPVNPDLPALADFATGAQLDNVIAETQRRKDSGLAVRLPDNSVGERRVKVASVEGEEALLLDCATNDTVLYRVDTGEVIDDSVATRSIEATMRLVDGKWRLAGTRELQKWEGVAGCAVSSDF